MSRTTWAAEWRRTWWGRSPGASSASLTWKRTHSWLYGCLSSKLKSSWTVIKKRKTGWLSIRMPVLDANSLPVVICQCEPKQPARWTTRLWLIRIPRMAASWWLNLVSSYLDLSCGSVLVLMRIRIQYFRSMWIRFRFPGFWWPNIGEKITDENFFIYIFWTKKCSLLFLGLH